MFSWLIKNKSYCPLNVLLVVRKHSSPRKLYRDFVTYGSKPGKSFLSTLNPWWSVFDIGSSLQGIDDHAYSWRSSFPLHWRGPCVSETQSHLKRPILSSLSSLFFVFCFVLPSTKEDQEKCEKLDPRFLCKVRNTKEPSWSGGCVCVCMHTQLCLTLCEPRDYSLPVSSVHGISQARTLKLVATSFSWWSSQPKDWTPASPTLVDLFFTSWATIIR